MTTLPATAAAAVGSKLQNLSEVHFSLGTYSISKVGSWEFPGSPMVRTLPLLLVMSKTGQHYLAQSLVSVISHTQFSLPVPSKVVSKQASLLIYLLKGDWFNKQGVRFYRILYGQAMGSSWSHSYTLVLTRKKSGQYTYILKKSTFI